MSRLFAIASKLDLRFILRCISYWNVAWSVELRLSMYRAVLDELDIWSTLSIAGRVKASLETRPSSIGLVAVDV